LIEQLESGDQGKKDLSLQVFDFSSKGNFGRFFMVLRLALFGIKHAVLSHDIYDFLESKSLIFFETT
jgi:hypothetical protein